MISLTFSVWWLLIPYFVVGYCLARAVAFMWMDIGPTPGMYAASIFMLLAWPLAAVLFVLYLLVAWMLLPFRS